MDKQVDGHQLIEHQVTAFTKDLLVQDADQKTKTMHMFSQELSSKPGFTQRVQETLHALEKIDHPSLLPVQAGNLFEGNFYLVEEVFEKASPLMGLKEPLAEVEVIALAKTLIDAYEALKDQAHGWISPATVFYQESGFKIGGLGILHAEDAPDAVQSLVSVIATMPKEPIQQILDQQGDKKHKTAFYQLSSLAPEVVFQGTLTKQSDLFSIGVVLYYALTAQLPTLGCKKPSQLNSKLEKNWDHLVRGLMHKDPQDRLSNLPALFEELLHVGSTKQPLHQVDETLQETFERAQKEAQTKKANPFAGNYRPPEVQQMTSAPKVVDPTNFMQTEMTVSQYVPKETQVIDLEPIKTTTVAIPAGKYWRGSRHGPRDEMPRHQVDLQGFSLDVHPITNEQFIRYLETIGGVKDDQNNDVIRLKDSRIKILRGQFSIEPGYAQHPVVGVTWYGASAYATWVGGRLPTEAEWETAASGGKEDRLYPTGKEISKNQANFFSTDTTRVMSYPANNIGLFDMAGNVYEWCEDWYDFHYYDSSQHESTSPKGPVQGVYRTLRGGCWKSLQEDLRCAHRHRNNPRSFNATYGFRVAFDNE